MVQDPLKLSHKELTIEAGEWKEIYVTSGRCVNWNTSNQNVVRIYSEGDPTSIKIKGESYGTAEVIAYAPDGTTTICKVTVFVQKVDPDPVYQTEPVYIVDEPEYFVEAEPVEIPKAESHVEATPEAESETDDDFAADDAAAG